MSFSDDFTQCMSPLPTPSNLGDSVDDVVDFLDQLHSAWEFSGGDDAEALDTLVIAGAVVGIDEAALATAGVALGGAAAITVSAYIQACVACSLKAGLISVWDSAGSVWDWITRPALPGWLQSQLQAQAITMNIPQPGSDDVQTA